MISASKNNIPNEEIPSHWLLRQLWPAGVALPLRLAKDAAARLRLARRQRPPGWTFKGDNRAGIYSSYGGFHKWGYPHSRILIVIQPAKLDNPKPIGFLQLKK